MKQEKDRRRSTLERDSKRRVSDGERRGNRSERDDKFELCKKERSIGDISSKEGGNGPW